MQYTYINNGTSTRDNYTVIVWTCCTSTNQATNICTITVCVSGTSTSGTSTN